MGGGGRGTLLPQLFAPASAAPPHMFLADKCGETFDLFFIYIYIKFCWKQRLALLQGGCMCCFYIFMHDLHITTFTADLSDLRLLLWNSFNLHR